MYMSSMAISSCFVILVLAGFISSAKAVAQVAGFATLGSRLEASQQIDYYISNYELDHYAAVLECRLLLNGRLLTLLTLGQDEYVRIRLQTLGYGEFYVCTAGRYIPDSRAWEWVTIARAFGYDNWRPGEPQNSEGLCACLLGESSGFGWVTRECSYKHLFVCEMTL